MAFKNPYHNLRNKTLPVAGKHGNEVKQANLLVLSSSVKWKIQSKTAEMFFVVRRWLLREEKDNLTG